MSHVADVCCILLPATQASLSHRFFGQRAQFGYFRCGSLRGRSQVAEASRVYLGLFRTEHSTMSLLAVHCRVSSFLGRMWCVAFARKRWTHFAESDVLGLWRFLPTMPRTLASLARTSRVCFGTSKVRMLLLLLPPAMFCSSMQLMACTLCSNVVHWSCWTAWKIWWSPA